ncbi:hypothetical protein ACM39_02625 [Chryseobacterium sp. FH2]|uniref:hypothetical protein n=1 Tax=Chryseobacterium sp. FH2 TaxID=1674291 RepID=UPI00065AAD27|nr:hypothetical protein [Chryseobacterium sp. FH2]KMQ69952.1 hypothetical protein ACM39_02625 [Chryseobacterium sp. FH2]
MSTDKTILKSWFVTAAKPTQDQFWAWMDSYYHKNELLSMNSIYGLENILANKAEASALQYLAVKDGSNIENPEQWKDKLDITLLDSNKANKDATELSPENVEAWRGTLGVGNLPKKNIATNDGEDDDGNPISGTSYTKEQSDEKYYKKVDAQYFNSNYVLLADGTPKAAGDLGKNIANSSLTSVAGAGMTLGSAYTWNTAGQYFYITGLADKVNESSYSNVMLQNASGQLGYGNLTQLFMKFPESMTVTQRNDWISKMNVDIANTYLQLITVIDGNFINGTTDSVITIYGLNINRLQGLDQVTMELIGPDGNPVPDNMFDVISYSVNNNSELAVSFHFEPSYIFMTGEYTLKVIRKLVILGEIGITAYNSYSDQVMSDSEFNIINNGLTEATYSNGILNVSGVTSGANAIMKSINPLPAISDYDIMYSISGTFIGANWGAADQSRSLYFYSGLSLGAGTSVHIGGQAVPIYGQLGLNRAGSFRIMSGVAQALGYNVESTGSVQLAISLKIDIQKRGQRYKVVIYKQDDDSLLYAGLFNNTNNDPMYFYTQFVKSGYGASMSSTLTALTKRTYI